MARKQNKTKQHKENIVSCNQNSLEQQKQLRNDWEWENERKKERKQQTAKSG